MSFYQNCSDKGMSLTLLDLRSSMILRHFVDNRHITSRTTKIDDTSEKAVKL